MTSDSDPGRGGTGGSRQYGAAAGASLSGYVACLASHGVTFDPNAGTFQVDDGMAGHYSTDVNASTITFTPHMAPASWNHLDGIAVTTCDGQVIGQTG